MLTQTFVQAKLVLKDIAEGVKEKSKSILKNSTRISALTMAAKLMTVVLVFGLMPSGTTYKNHIAKANYDTSIVFDKSDPFALKTTDNKIPLEIGQSRYDEEQSKIKNAAQVNGKSRPTKSVSRRDPAEFRPIYQAAAQQFGIPWQLIEAVHEVETGKSGSTAVRSYAGAQGPMQFMPGTWRAYQVDGNGDGAADITDVVDAIYTGAHYLARSGADEGRIDDALFNYNHSTAYVNKVKTIAYEIGL